MTRWKLPGFVEVITRHLVKRAEPELCVCVCFVFQSLATRYNAMTFNLIFIRILCKNCRYFFATAQHDPCFTRGIKKLQRYALRRDCRLLGQPPSHRFCPALISLLTHTTGTFCYPAITFPLLAEYYTVILYVPCSIIMYIHYLLSFRGDNIYLHVCTHTAGRHTWYVYEVQLENFDLVSWSLVTIFCMTPLWPQ